MIRFDLPRLGDVSGLRGVHLQCHNGTDTLSLARLGGGEYRVVDRPERLPHSYTLQAVKPGR